jgi:hypothetical protein
MQNTSHYFTRKRFGLLFQLFVLIAALAVSVAAAWLPAMTARGAETACGTSLASDKGQIKQQVHIATEETYTLWLRMLATSATSDSVLVQVDDTCIVVAGDSRAGDGFQWIDYREGVATNKLSFTLKPGAHTLSIAGREVGTGLDMAMFIKGTCTPAGDGANCVQAAAPVGNDTPRGQSPATETSAPATANGAMRWLLLASIVIAAVALGLLIWRYLHCAKHHDVVGAVSLGRRLVQYCLHHRVFVAVCGGVLGAALITGFVAAADTAQAGFEAETAALSGGVRIVEDKTASGGKYVVFELNGSAGTVGRSTPTANNTTPTGSQSGGATNTGGSPATPVTYPYPDRYSVGAPGIAKYRQSDATLPVPSGYTELFPSNSNVSNAYNLYNCSGVTNLDRVYIHAFIYVGTGCHGTINVTNSIIAPPPGTTQRAILVNADNSASLTINISDTTIRPEPVPLGGTNNALTDHIINDCETCTIHLNRLDVANSGGMCLCGRNTIVENSWLHDSYIAHLSDPSVAHTGGVFPYGGSGPLTIRNNRLEPGVDAFTGVAIPNYWKAITAVLFTQASGGTMLRNYTVENNFISLGSFNMGLENGEDLVIKNNVFGPHHFDYITTCSSGCSVSIATWTGNVVGDISGKPTSTVVAKPF